MNLKKKSSGIWMVDYEDAEGRRRRVSTGLKDKAEAAKRAREIVLGIDVRPAPGDPLAKVTEKSAKGVTMREMFDHCLKTCWAPSACKSQRTVLSNLRILDPLVGDWLVKDVTFLRLDGLREELQARNYAPATIKRKLDAVGKALTEAARRGVISSRPPMPIITIANTKERILEHGEEAAVFAAIARRAEAEPQRPWVRFGHLITFLLETGCRLSEPLQATLDWIDTHGGRAIFAIPAAFAKSDRGRGIPLTPAVEAILPYLRMTSTNNRLFPMSPAVAWYMWDTIREDVKLAEGSKHNIDDVVLHTLRHTCLTRMVRAGFAIHHVSKWAGHSDVRITMERYVKQDAGDLIGAMDAVHGRPTHLRVVA